MRIWQIWVACGTLKNVLFHIFRFSFHLQSQLCKRYSSSQRGSWGEVITVISDLWLRDSRCVQALYCALYMCTVCSTAHLAVVSPLSTWPTTVIRHNITRFLTLHQMNSEGLITGLGQTLITLQGAGVIFSFLAQSLITRACGPVFSALPDVSSWPLTWHIADPSPCNITFITPVQLLWTSAKPSRRVKHNKIHSVIFIEQPFSQNRYTAWMGPAGRSFSSSQIVTVVAAFSPHLMRSGKVLRIWPIILCISSRCVPHHSHFSLLLARVEPGSRVAVIVMHLTFTPSQFWPLMDCSGSLLLGSREATSARHPVGHDT